MVSAQVASGVSLRRYSTSAQKMTRMLRPSAIAALRQHLHGPLVSADDADYNTARRVWNGRIDRRPALVAFCADEADVVAAVGFAREPGVLVAVRGGGHSCAGTTVCDDGLEARVQQGAMHFAALRETGRNRIRRF